MLWDLLTSSLLPSMPSAMSMSSALMDDNRCLLMKQNCACMCQMGQVAMWFRD